MKTGAMLVLAAVSVALVPVAAAQTFDAGPAFRYVADIDDDEGTIHYLGSPEDVLLVEHNGKIYAIATASGDNALGVFDITDQDEMDIVWEQRNNDEGGAGEWGLSDPTHIEPFSVTGDSKKYMLVTSPGRLGLGFFSPTEKAPASASSARGSGLQLVDITDPTAPAFVSFVGQGTDVDSDPNTDTKYDHLGGAYSSAVFSSGNNTYAISAGDFGNLLPGGLTVINISTPASPSFVWQSDGTWLSSLEGYRNAIDVIEINAVKHAVVAVNGELTNDTLDADHDGNLQIVSLANPSSPSLVFSSNTWAQSISEPKDVVTATINNKPYAVVSASSGEKTVVHVIDLSTPASPNIVATMTDDRGGFNTLAGAQGLHIESLGGTPYLFVPAWNDNGVQFVDLSNPASPRAVSDTRDEESDSIGNVCSGLAGATGIDLITVGGKTYAAISAQDDDALQMIEFTDTTTLAFLARGVIQDGALGFSTLETPLFVEDFEIDGRTYIAVTAYGTGTSQVPLEGGVQIIDVTNPLEPTPASSVSSDYTTEFRDAELKQLYELESFKLGSGANEKTYLILASGKGGFRILEVTNPSNPVQTSSVRDDATLNLGLVRGVTVYTDNGKTYAAVTARTEGAVSVVDITDPVNPAVMGSITKSDVAALGNPYGIDAFEIGTRTHVAVAATGANAVVIIDVEDPNNLAHRATFADTANTYLQRAIGVKSFVVNDTPYVVATGAGKPNTTSEPNREDDTGFTVLNVSSATNPTRASAQQDQNTGGSFTELRGAFGVDVFTLGSSTYAVFTCENGVGYASGFKLLKNCDGIQLANLSDPANPANGDLRNWYSNAHKDTSGNAVTIDKIKLARPQGVAAFETGGYVYAAVASRGTQPAFANEGIGIFRIGGIPDTTDPLLESAVLIGGTVLELQFDDIIDVSAITGAKLGDVYISAPGMANQHALSGSTVLTESDDIKVRIRLSPTLQTTVMNIPTIELDVSASAFTNVASRNIAASADNAIAKTEIKPVFRQAGLYLGPGALVAVFDRPIDVSEVDLEKFVLAGTEQSAPTVFHALSSSTGTSSVLNSLDGARLVIRLDEGIRQDVMSKALQLEVQAGAVKYVQEPNEAVPFTSLNFVEPDRTPPRISSAALDHQSSLLSVRFNETVVLQSGEPSRFALEGSGNSLPLTQYVVVDVRNGVSSTLQPSMVTSSLTATFAVDSAALAFARSNEPVRLTNQWDAIEDTSGRPVLSDPAGMIVLQRDASKPSVSSAEAVSTDSIKLTFDRPVRSSATDAQLAAAWTLGGTDAGSLQVRATTSLSSLTGALVLTLDGSLPDTDPTGTTVSYATTGLIEDDRPESMEAGTFPVADRIPPSVVSVQASARNQLTVAFSEGAKLLHAGNAPFGWSITGDPAAVSSYGGISETGLSSTATLRLTQNLASLDPQITVAYSGGNIGDDAGNALADFTGTASDRIPPPVPTVSAPPALTNSDSLTVSGTSAPGSTVRLVLNGSAGPSVAADASGDWSARLTLAEGSNSVSARALDSAGNASADSAAQTVVLDTMPPAPPVISTARALISSSTHVVSGTAEDGSLVTVTGRVSTGSATTVYSTKTATAAAGAWSVTLDISEGLNSVTATAADPASNESRPSDELYVRKDTTPPSLVSAEIRNRDTITAIFSEPVTAEASSSTLVWTLSGASAGARTVSGHPAVTGSASVDLAVSSPLDLSARDLVLEYDPGQFAAGFADRIGLQLASATVAVQGLSMHLFDAVSPSDSYRMDVSFAPAAPVDLTRQLYSAITLRGDSALVLSSPTFPDRPVAVDSADERAAAVYFAPRTALVGAAESIRIELSAPVSRPAPDVDISSYGPQYSLSDAVVWQVGDPNRDLAFDRPVRIDLGEGAIGPETVVFSIDTAGAVRLIPACSAADTWQSADAFISALEADASVNDNLACFSDPLDSIWTKHFSQFGTATLERAPAPRQPAYTGGGGGGGGGGSVSGTTLGGSGADAVYVRSASWDCQTGLITVAAGPTAGSLDVTLRLPGAGLVRMTQSGDSDGYGVFTAPFDSSEYYARISATLVSARAVVSDSESIEMDSCTGTQTFDVPAPASAASLTPAPGPEPAPQQEPADEPAAQPEPVREAPAEPAPPAPEPPAPITQEPVTQEPAVQEPECGPGTFLSEDGECEPVGADDGGGCLIATAAYGTETAPLVQQLREIRDGAVYSTGTGAGFMSAFNEAYYAFSPAVADLQRSSPAFKEAVRASLQPLLWSLGIMSLAEPGSEHQVALLGSLVILFNASLLGSPAAAVLAYRRLARARPGPRAR